MCRLGRWIAGLTCLWLSLGAVAKPLAPVAPEQAVTQAARVVGLEFAEVEMLLALGVKPAGIADVAGYRRWVGVGAEGLSEARDLGTRQEPSLEALIALEPDLIVGSWWRNGALAPTLRQIAPTLLYDDLPDPKTQDQFARMRSMLTDLGRRLGCETQAEAVLARLDRSLAERREALAREGLADQPVVLAQVVPGTHRFRFFTDNSLAVQVAERLGLENAWQGEPEAFGFNTVGLDALAELGKDARLLLVADYSDPSFAKLSKSALWQALPVVAGGRLAVLPRDTWFFGGPLSAQRLAERLGSTLVAQPSGKGQVAQ